MRQDHFEEPIIDDERLFQLLYEQEITQHKETLVRRFQTVITQKIFQPGDEIIKQGEANYDLWLILSGSVTIWINGRQVVEREAKTHVGEMALLDSSLSRTATVRAVTPVLAGKICAAEFKKIAKDHPIVWRIVAEKLVSRLQDSNKGIKPPNNPLQIFIGSSKEDEKVAREFSEELSRNNAFDVIVWTSSRAFSVGFTSIENLENLKSSDFALFVLGENDRIETRGKEKIVPRDNVIFELGLFMGALGRERSFVVITPGSNPELPTDLQGLTLIILDNENSATLSGRVKLACDDKIRKRIQDLGAR